MKKISYPKRIYGKQEQKEILFDALMSRYLGNRYRDRWVENPAFIYTISRHMGISHDCYLLEVTAPKGGYSQTLL